MRSKHTLRFQ